MRWRRWSDLSGVERVGRYTRQSLYALLWFFNGVILVTSARDADGTAQVVVLLAGGFAVTAAGFAVMEALLRDTPRPLNRTRVAPLLVLAAAFYVFAATVLEGDARGAAVMTVTSSLTLSLGLVADQRLSVALVLLAAALFGVAGGEAVNLFAGLVAAGAFVFTSRASIWLYGTVAELDTARQAQSQLAVAEERLRFSRDVHDVLGRRLSTIAVQAELAATLAERGDERGPERMLEVRGIAHEALREARELARGYRPTADLPKELEGARSLLRSAGIEVAATVDAMPRAWHEAAGWVVREAITNVLRHSSATRVEITYADERLTLVNDGARPSDGAEGSGLRSLQERLAPLGAALVAAGEGGRWTVTARLPGTGPLSATAPEEEPDL